MIRVSNDRGIAMIVLKVFGGIVVVALGGAAIFDHRARRRGYIPGPDGTASTRLNIEGEAPAPQRGIISGSGFRPPHETERRGPED
jgi:hypothetical protein